MEKVAMMRERLSKNYRKFRSDLDFILNSFFFELAVLILIVTSVVLLIVDHSITLKPGSEIFVGRLSLVLNIFFIIEYILRFFAAPSRLYFFRTNLLELAAILPVLRVFRLFRVLRIIRIVKIVRQEKLTRKLANRFDSYNRLVEERTSELLFVVIILISILLIGALGIFILEKNENPQFESFADSLWWAVVTLTTVGYGDKFPVTQEGRVLAVLFMLLGLSFFAMLTGFVSSIIIERSNKRKFEGMEIKGIKDHIVILGWNDHGEELTSELIKLYQKKRTKIVLVADEKPGNILTDQLYFVKGDYLKKEILSRTRLEWASAVIILADNQCERTIEDADARTILASLAVKNSNPEIYTCAEILSIDNVPHIINSGADEYILSSSLTGNMLAHSVKNPGISTVFSELLKADHGSDIHLIDISETHAGMKFKEEAVELLTQNKILIGIKRNSEYLLNPDCRIEPGDRLIIIK